jgi:hypothetical protein
MKKMILCLSLLVGMFNFSFAQKKEATSDSKSSGSVKFHEQTPEESAKWMVNMYAERLNLTVAQKSAIYRPILRTQKELATASTRNQWREITFANHYYLEQEFKNIFTYSQYLKYEQMETYPDGIDNPNYDHNKR